MVGEFRQFLGFASGSGGELYTQLILAKRLGLSEQTQLDPLIQRLEDTNKGIAKLIYTLK